MLFFVWSMVCKPWKAELAREKFRICTFLFIQVDHHILPTSTSRAFRSLTFSVFLSTWIVRCDIWNRWEKCGTVPFWVTLLYLSISALCFPIRATHRSIWVRGGEVSVTLLRSPVLSSRPACSSYKVKANALKIVAKLKKWVAMSKRWVAKSRRWVAKLRRWWLLLSQRDGWLS